LQGVVAVALEWMGGSSRVIPAVVRAWRGRRTMVDEAFALLVDVVRQLQASGARPQLSGLKDQLRKRRPGFSERRYGFNTFLSFAKAAQVRNLVGMAWDQTTNEYLLQVPD
jgi:hypothetical protein